MEVGWWCWRLRRWYLSFSPVTNAQREKIAGTHKTCPKHSSSSSQVRARLSNNTRRHTHTLTPCTRTHFGAYASAVLLQMKHRCSGHAGCITHLWRLPIKHSHTHSHPRTKKYPKSLFCTFPSLVRLQSNDPVEMNVLDIDSLASTPSHPPSSSRLRPITVLCWHFRWYLSSELL